MRRGGLGGGGGCWSLGNQPWCCSLAQNSEVQRIPDNFLSGEDKVCTSLQSGEEVREGSSSQQRRCLTQGQEPEVVSLSIY